VNNRDSNTQYKFKRLAGFLLNYPWAVIEKSPVDKLLISIGTMAFTGALFLRIFQIISAVIVLGLSVSLLQGQNPRLSNAPIITTYNIFLGGWGLFTALIGLLAVCIIPLQNLVGGFFVISLDGFSAFLYLCGAIAMAVRLGLGNCGDVSFTEFNDIINGGYAFDEKGNFLVSSNVPFEARCQKAKATTAFLFFGMAAFLGSIGITLLLRRGKLNAYV